MDENDYRLKSLGCTTENKLVLCVFKRHGADRDTVGSQSPTVGEPNLAYCKASHTPTIELTDETQSRLWLTSLDMEQLSIIGSVVLAVGLPETPYGPQENTGPLIVQQPILSHC